MIKSYNVTTDITSQTLDLDILEQEIIGLNLGIDLEYINRSGDDFTIKFISQLSVPQWSLVDALILAHDANVSPVKIYSYIADELKNLDFTDIDYTIIPKPNLYPKRTMVQGEVQLVEWYSDQSLTDKVLEVSISYTRDPYGFAVSRTTTRKWFRQDGTQHPRTKVTTKKYDINPADQITEGKRRRGNIVNDIQLPTMALMIESMTVPPYNLTVNEILLMGRDFLDRHETEFNNFINNSSTVTDVNDPDFGKKKIVVALELASTTTDTWLVETPATLGGASILQYLVGEFSI